MANMICQVAEREVHSRSIAALKRERMKGNTAAAGKAAARAAPSRDRASVGSSSKSLGTARRGIQRGMGLHGQTTVDLIGSIDAGFPYSMLQAFQRLTDLPMSAVAELVRIPGRTLLRRRAVGRLQPDESDRLLRSARIVEKAVELFEGDRKAGMKWLQSPQPALAGRTPLDFARTDIGAREVEDLIGRLEHGVFT